MSADGRLDVLVTGIGGQGIVLASRLLAQAHMARGDFVRVAETIGMSQRGGSVVSHVRVAPAGVGIASSLLPLGTASLVLAFEPGEALRTLPYLAEDGVLVSAIRAQRPITASLAGLAYDGAAERETLRRTVGRFVEIDGDALTREAGSARCLNVVLLGAALGAGALRVSRDELAAALAVRVKPAYLDLNERALDLGIEAGSRVEETNE